MWWQRETYGKKKSFNEIGAMYANRDHCVAMKAFKKDHHDLMETDAGYRTKAEQALKNIQKLKISI